MMRRLFLTGCGYLGGQPIPGVQHAPDIFRKHFIKERITKLGYQVEDGGNIKNSFSGSLDTFQISKVNEKLYRHLIPKLKNKNINTCLTLGGDHSIALGTVSATLKTHPDAFIVWIDAHADINTPQTSMTKNLHGMPLSYLMGFSEKQDIFSWLKPRLQPDNLAYFGLRDIDDKEMDIINVHGIKYFSTLELRKNNIKICVNEALKKVDPKRPIHISFDIDSLDPKYAPMTGTRVQVGLTPDECQELIREIRIRNQNIVNIDIVELNPELESFNPSKDIHETIENSFKVLDECLIYNSTEKISVGDLYYY